MPLDVLLAGLERQDEAAPSFAVDGLADDPAGQVADVLLLCGDEAEGRSAEGEGVAEALAVADGDVDPHVSRGFEEPQDIG